MKRIWYILVLLVMTKESFIMANPSKPVPFFGTFRATGLGHG